MNTAKLMAFLAAVILVGPTVADDKPATTGDIQDFVYFAEGRPLFVRAHVRVDGKSYQAVWGEYVDKVMKFLDKNGDGVLTGKEIEQMPPIQFLTGNLAMMSPVIKGKPGESLDANRDGKITRDELAAYLKKQGAAPFQFQVGSGTPGLYGAKVITLGQAEPVNASELNRAIFAMLDTNKDGKLSREELAAAPSILAKLDANDDEMITAREIVPHSGAKPGYGFLKDAAAAVVVTRSEPAAASGEGPVMLINAGESGSALARELLKRYSPKGDKTRKLKASDLGMDQATFNHLDADKDGALDAEELAQFARRAPDVELTLRIGKKGDKEAAVEGSVRAGGAIEAKLTKDKGGMTLELGVTQIQLRAGNPAQDAKFNFSFRLRDQYINQFKMADTDNNGYLDEKEAAKNPLFRNIFKALDTDGDGMLFEKEMVAYVDKIEELQRAVREGCVTLALSDRGSGIFDQMDRDHDGRLSVREIRDAVSLIKTLDRDGDGLLALAEVPRSLEARLRPGPAGNGADFGNVVVVAKSILLGDSSASEKTAGPIWFRKMDTNRDGDLSRREFLGNDEQFKQIDADGDGLISLKEAEAFDKLARKAGSK